MRSTDPSRMSCKAILAELGEILAAGLRRHISSSIGHSASDADAQKPLAEAADPEAQCGGSKETSK